ncbi:cation:proton antiporter [Candidatus Gottesmanbacteria bacterium]|nr:cation:proton antiporter [Candidatus Gottesmanbacteria bacterium]
MGNFSFTRDLILVLATAFAGGFIAKKFRQPLLTGYILGGVIVGGVASRFFAFDQNLVSLAEIGVALLMFTLGIEFSWARFKRISPGIIFGAIIQILGIILFSVFVLPRLGFDFYSSIFLGSAFALSSTAVVVKILSDKGELDTLSGELTVGWLLLQDLAVLPLIVVLPALAINLRQEAIFWQSLAIFGQAIAKAVLLLALVIFMGKKFMPLITEKILKTHSRELLLLLVVSFCLILAFGTASLGLSFALGAFLAGFLIAEVGIMPAIFAEIRPLRDILAVIFFVTLGFLISPQFLLVNFGKIVLLSFTVIVVKFFLVIGIILYLGYHTKIAFLTGVSLTQVGEFAFVLGQMGVKMGVISQEVNFTIISVALTTLILTPWMMGLAAIVYCRLKTASIKWPALSSFFSKFDKKPPGEGLPFENHVVICGFGRVGKYIGRALEMAKIPFIVVDYNHEVIKELKSKGLDVVYGDPSEIDVLDFAQVDKAKAIVVAIPDRQTQEMVIANAQTLRPGIKIICRTHHEEDQARLRALRVETIIQPEFEAAVTIVSKLLSGFGASSEEIDGKIKRLKIEHGMQ